MSLKLLCPAFTRPSMPKSVNLAERNARVQIAMACMILGIIFFGILLGSIAEALQVSRHEQPATTHYF